MHLQNNSVINCVNIKNNKKYLTRVKIIFKIFNQYKTGNENAV